MVAFAPPGRLVRRITSPTESVALIERGQLTLASGDRRETVDLSTNDVVAAFVDTFRHVLAGELSALEETYRIDFVVDGPRWTTSVGARAPNRCAVSFENWCSRGSAAASSG